jgi:tetratricopeptide (TPR) repeat protein
MEGGFSNSYLCFNGIEVIIFANMQAPPLTTQNLHSFVSRLMLLIFISLTVYSCYSKKQMKQGHAFEQNGQYESAYRVYNYLYELKSHQDARLAAARMAQTILLQKCTRVDSLCMVSNFEGARIAYNEASDYSRQHVSEKLNTSCLSNSYANWKFRYGSYLAAQARMEMNQGNFGTARELCEKYLSVAGDESNENTRNVRMTLLVCELAPKFKEGQRLFARSKWREAHEVFQDIVDQDPDFKLTSDDKSAEDYSLLCEENGGYNLTFRYVESAFGNSSNEVTGLFDEIESSISDDPFITIYAGEESLKPLEAELRRTMEPTYEQSDQSPQAGMFVSAQYVLMGKASNYVYKPIDGASETKKPCSCKDVPNIGRIDDSMVCFKIEKTSVMSMDFVYKLMHVESGRIEFSRNFPSSKGPKEVVSTGVAYEIESRFSGRVIDSMIGLMKDGLDTIKGSETGRAQEGVYTVVGLKSEEEMLQELYEIIAQSVAENLRSYSPKK